MLSRNVVSKIFQLKAIFMKPNFTLFFLFLITFQTQAQKIRLSTANPNGLVEVLYFDYAKESFEYSRDNSKNKIQLETFKIEETDYEKIYHVKFPNDNQIYKIAALGEGISCENPDGSIQYFVPEEKYICKNSNGVIEYLYTSGPPPMFAYSSSKKPTKISLETTGGDMMNSNFEVQFPNDSKVYVLEFAQKNSKITLTNPDGSIQIFNREIY